MSRICLLPGVFAVLLTSATASANTDIGDPYHQKVDGLDVYIGIAPADAVRRRGGPDALMHGAYGTVPSEKHVVLAIFDATSGARITDARGTLRVVGGKPHPLELMNGDGAVSFGNYLILPDDSSHQVRVEISRPGAAHPTVMTFTYPLSAR